MEEDLGQGFGGPEQVSEESNSNPESTLFWWGKGTAGGDQGYCTQWCWRLLCNSVLLLQPLKVLDLTGK